MTISQQAWDAARIRQLRSATLQWYEKNGRRLPWRESADPYRVWLSEIMLQQTTVTSVIPYFERFIAKFPDVESLASAIVDDVMRLWEGLGYYSRARNLHNAAQVIVRDHAGQFPTDVMTLKTLPGIGRYTAGAITSFAFDKPAAIVEANTERLYARLIALENDVRSTAAQKTLWEFAGRLVPKKRPGDFNQALMDIGSKICRPQDPDCTRCPLVNCCVAFEKGLQTKLPVRKPRVSVTRTCEVGIVLHRNGKYLLRRRSHPERWAGMWDFIRFEIAESDISALPWAQPLRPAKKTAASSPGQEKLVPRASGESAWSKSLFNASGERLPESITGQIQDQAGIEAGDVLAAMEFEYSVTRFKVRMLCFVCETPGFVCEAPETDVRKQQDLQWFSTTELVELPLSATGRRIALWLEGFRNRQPGGS